MNNNDEQIEKNELTEKNKNFNDFQIKKIKDLNKFFMKSIYLENFMIVIFFLLMIGALIYITFLDNLTNEFKITLISLCISFLTATCKTIIEHYISLIKYKNEVLFEEQRALAKEAGLEIDKILLSHKEKKDNEE